MSSRQHEQVTLTFTGDLCFGGAVQYYCRKGLYSYTDLFKHVASVLRDSDLTIGNYEGVMVKPDTPLLRITGNKTLYVSTETDSVKGLQFAGFNVMGVANNHTQDYGDAAAMLTYNTIENAGIHTIGFNFGDWDSPQEPLVKNIKGVRVGFLCYCYTGLHQITSSKDQRVQLKCGSAIYDHSVFERDIQSLKDKGVDVIIVYMHWGHQYHSRPEEHQRDIARSMSELGVHAVIGCHSHWQQTHEYINKTLVVYDLGIFLFGMRGLNRPFYDTILEGRSDPVSVSPTEEDEENFVVDYRHRTGPDKYGRILRIIVDKSGLVEAKYLPIEVKMDFETKCLQPTPIQEEWVEVCSPGDQWCHLTGSANEPYLAEESCTWGTYAEHMKRQQEMLIKANNQEPPCS